MEREKTKGVVFNTFKVLVSLGLIAFLIARTDMKMVQRVLFSVHGGFLVLGVLFMMLEIVLITYRLQVLLLMRDIRVSFFVLLKLNLISVFVGIFLPSMLGTDALRIFYLSKHTKQVVDSISSVALDRFLNMLTITVFAVLSFFIGGYYRTMPGLLLALLPMVMGIGFVFLFLSKKIRSSMGAFLNRIRMPRKITHWLGDLVRSFYGGRAYPKLLLLLVALAIVFQCVRITSSYVFARSVWIEAPYSYYYICMPIVTVLGMLPFAVAGIGITQASSVYFFELVGVNIESAFGFSILVYVIRILVTLPGLYFFYREGLDALVESASRTKIFSIFRRKETS